MILFLAHFDTASNCALQFTITHSAGHGSSRGRRDRDFESHFGHGCLVCVCVYSVSVLSCV
jgi:hypothetical protein